MCVVRHECVIIRMCVYAYIGEGSPSFFILRCVMFAGICDV
jgi:hypothetical protein